MLRSADMWVIHSGSAVIATFKITPAETWILNKTRIFDEFGPTAFCHSSEDRPLYHWDTSRNQKAIHGNKLHADRTFYG
jgi:hypothetical protein